MKIEMGKFNLTIGWKAIAVITTSIIVNALSKREQLNALNIDLGNKILSLN